MNERIFMDDGENIEDKSEKIAVLSVSLTFCALSVFMSLLILIFYVRYSSLRQNFGSQLIVTISFMDFIQWGLRVISSIFSLTHDLQTYEEISHSLCMFAGFCFSFFNLVVFFCVLVIGVSLFCDFVLKYDLSPHRHLIFFSLYFTCFALSAIPIFTDDYGRIDDVKCWIVGYWERLLTFYFPLWSIIFIDFFLIGKVIYELQGMNFEVKMKRNLAIKFALFPLFMLISWLPSSIKRVLGINNFYLKVVMYAMMPMQGVFNPIIYGMINSEVKVKILECLCCEWKKNEDHVSSPCEIDPENTKSKAYPGLYFAF